MAKEASHIVPLFQLKNIELHELIISKAISPTNFNFEITVEASVDRYKKLIINLTKVKIRGENQDAVLGSITCACIFSVANLEEVITMKGDTVAEINEPFAETLNSISISTVRGIMFSELKGTELHHAIIPIVDVKKLVKTTV